MTSVSIRSVVSSHDLYLNLEGIFTHIQDQSDHIRRSNPIIFFVKHDKLASFYFNLAQTRLFEREREP